MPENKGKLICKVGDLALLLEYYKTQEPNFRFVIVDKQDNVLAGTTIDIAGTVFLSKCLDAAITETMSYNIRSNFFGGSKDGKST